MTNPTLDLLARLTFRESPMMCDRVISRPMRTHHRRRTQKKWIKRWGYLYKDVPWKHVYQMDGGRTIVGHPVTIAGLKAELQKFAKAHEELTQAHAAKNGKRDRT